MLHFSSFLLVTKKSFPLLPLKNSLGHFFDKTLVSSLTAQAISCTPHVRLSVCPFVSLLMMPLSYLVLQSVLSIYPSRYVCVTNQIFETLTDTGSPGQIRFSDLRILFEFLPTKQDCRALASRGREREKLNNSRPDFARLKIGRSSFLNNTKFVSFDSG